MSFAEGLVGITLDGRYRLDALLGEGGMGAVFRATHLAMERKVAVKLLKPHLTNDEMQLQRFAREARSTLKVDSPHAVKVLDFGVTPHKDYYMVLEYLDGRTVQRELDIDGPFTAKRTVHIARHALHALGAAHRSGFVHRDIKPDNLLLMRVGSDPDYTKVLDFGVAKLMEGAAHDPSQLALTQVGMVFGTPEFMSPEQACGHSLDGRSDLYSLAATMYVMLTGSGLFAAGSAIEWLTHHARTPPPRFSTLRPELATYRELEELLERCLAKHRDKRPATAEELEELLAKLEDTLDRPAGSLPPTKRTFSASAANFSASAYMHALPAAMVDPGTTLLPPDLANEERSTVNLRPRSEPDATTMPPSDETGMHPVKSSRGAFFVALGALVIIGMITTAVVIASSRRTSRSASVDAVIAVATPVLPADAAISDAAVDALVAATHPDAAVRVVRTNPKLEEHLRKAEEALRSKNMMGQLTQADLALQADPRNQRAKYLYGDALIKYGQTDKGCRYLRAAGKKNPACRGD
ncbi:MAG: serine/threonine protein kinase [Myxococcota bacterium]|nr:serine/threonine protein kinase [Myxococcota bacterium]